jgi:Tol biopolymer transport system component
VSSSAFDGGRIWLRNLSDATARALNDTEGARGLFWAPDGSGIGFFSAGWLRIVTTASGTVRALAPATNEAGGAWAPDGTILYSPFFLNLWRVSVAGGTAKRALGPSDDSTGGSRDPNFLPDGHHFVFWRSVTNDSWLGDLADGSARKLADSMTTPMYVDPGVLLFFKRTSQLSLEQPAPLFAQRFDPNRMQLSGEPVVVSQRVDRPDQVPIVSATSEFVVMREPASRDAGAAHGTIYWLDRATGRRGDPVRGTGGAWAFRAAHTGRYFALSGPGLSIYDAQRDVAVRHAAQIPIGGWPQAWSPDDRDIAVNAGPRIFIVRVDGSAPERSFRPSLDTWANPVDWSPDGTIYCLLEPMETLPHRELWRHDLGTGKDEHVATGSGDVFDARLSPDWQWIAWESNESGRHEIYLGAAKGGATPVRVSKAGGGSPRWRRDGKELFFLGGDGRIMSVAVQLGTPPVLGEPRRVADLVIHPEPMGNDPWLDTRFEPTPSGDRFLVQTPLGAGTHQLTLIQGWRRKVPAR